MGLSLVYWVVGFLFAAGIFFLHFACWLLIAFSASLCVYLEFATYFPHRSGAEVVYLEKVQLMHRYIEFADSRIQAYPRPRFLMPIAFAVQSVLLSFSSSNAISLLLINVAESSHENQSLHSIFSLPLSLKLRRGESAGSLLECSRSS